jgi:hypothetical protein
LTDPEKSSKKMLPAETPSPQGSENSYLNPASNANPPSSAKLLDTATPPLAKQCQSNEWAVEQKNKWY